MSISSWVIILTVIFLQQNIFLSEFTLTVLIVYQLWLLNFISEAGYFL